jgi:hypothetical protein
MRATSLILKSIICLSFILGGCRKDKGKPFMTKPIIIGDYQVYEANENYAAAKYVDSSAPEYDIDNDGKMDFKFLGTLKMYSPGSGWHGTELTCLHEEAFIMGYTSIDTTFSYMRPLYTADTVPPILTYIYYGPTCSKNSYTFPEYTTNSGKHVAYLSSANESYTGEWLSELFEIKRINSIYHMNTVEAPDTVFLYLKHERITCWNIPEDETTFIQFKVNGKFGKTYYGAFELTSSQFLYRIWIKK